MRDKLLFTGLLFLFSFCFTIAQIPAGEQEKPVAIVGGTAHLGTGEVIENSLITFKEGKLEKVEKNNNEIPEGYTVINAEGKHIYPGLIAPNTTLGLVEISSVRATRDYNEAGTYTPHVRSLIAYNTDSKIIPTVRANGILLAQSTPRGNRISGTSSVMMLDGWNWEDAVSKKDDGIHLNWPNRFIKTGWWAAPGPMKKNEKHQEQLEELRLFFTDALAYYKKKDPETANVKFEAMKGIFDGSKNLYVHANHAKEIVEAVNFAKKYGIRKPVIVGGLDAWMVTDILKEKNIPVILSRIHDLPLRDSDDIDQVYKLPATLHENGILFALGYEGDMEAMGVRNLPFIAGTAAAYGLDKEEALKSITLNTARILGIDNYTGSLEPGKEATLFISDGDALDMLTNKVEVAFIRGKQIDLNNKQKELYQKYKEKYKEEED